MRCPHVALLCSSDSLLATMALNRARVLREVSRSCAGARCFSAAAEAEKVKVEVSREDGRFRVKTFNAISPLGLERFPASSYDVSGAEPDAHAILLRSHKLKSEEVATTVRAIARCGEGRPGSRLQKELTDQRALHTRLREYFYSRLKKGNA